MNKAEDFRLLSYLAADLRRARVVLHGVGRSRFRSAIVVGRVVGTVCVCAAVEACALLLSLEGLLQRQCLC